jgi:hypothetical protein
MKPKNSIAIDANGIATAARSPVMLRGPGPQAHAKRIGPPSDSAISWPKLEKLLVRVGGTGRMKTSASATTAAPAKNAAIASAVCRARKGMTPSARDQWQRDVGARLASCEPRDNKRCPLHRVVMPQTAR